MVAWTLGMSSAPSLSATRRALAAKTTRTEDRPTLASSTTTSPDSPSATTVCSWPAILKSPAFPTLIATRLAAASTE
jgi:hypothetical protein